MDSTRRHQRVSATGEVQIVDHGEVVRVALVDISRGGVCVEGPVAEGGDDAPVKLFVTVLAPDGRKRMWMLEAQLVWHRGERHGLEFTEVPVDVYGDLVGLEGAEQDVPL